LAARTSAPVGCNRCGPIQPGTSLRYSPPRRARRPRAAQCPRHPRDRPPTRPRCRTSWYLPPPPQPWHEGRGLVFVIMVHGQRSDAEALWGAAACCSRRVRVYRRPRLGWPTSTMGSTSRLAHSASPQARSPGRGNITVAPTRRRASWIRSSTRCDDLPGGHPSHIRRAAAPAQPGGQRLVRLLMDL